MTGTLVILRHGQSEWNLANLFTGWHDVALTDKGTAEASAAGTTMAEAGIRFDTSHTSLQTRAVVTQNLALAAMGQEWLPVERSWRLNERHYGALQGLDKKQTTERHGSEQVQAWRRSYDTPPPPVELDSPEHPANDPRYSHLPPDVLPATECLKDVVEGEIVFHKPCGVSEDMVLLPFAAPCVDFGYPGNRAKSRLDDPVMERSELLQGVTGAGNDIVIDFAESCGDRSHLRPRDAFGQLYGLNTLHDQLACKIDVGPIVECNGDLREAELRDGSNFFETRKPRDRLLDRKCYLLFDFQR